MPKCRRCHEGAEMPVAPGYGAGQVRTAVTVTEGTVRSESGAGRGHPRPSPSPICPESGTLRLTRPRPRFAETGDQAAVLEYPKGVERVLPKFGPITRR